MASQLARPCRDMHRISNWAAIDSSTSSRPWTNPLQTPDRCRQCIGQRSFARSVATGRRRSSLVAHALEVAARSVALVIAAAATLIIRRVSQITGTTANLAKQPAADDKKRHKRPD